MDSVEQSFGTDVKRFVEYNFYVDNGLASLATTTQAFYAMKRTQQALAIEGNFRQHKIAFISDIVMNAFPTTKSRFKLEYEVRQLYLSNV